MYIYFMALYQVYSNDLHSILFCPISLNPVLVTKKQENRFCNFPPTPIIRFVFSYDYQRFLSDYRDLIQWISGMTQLVSSEQWANDITGAEALLDRQQDYRTEIDARTGTFQAFEQFGDQLIQNRHYASEDIKQRQQDVQNALRNLEDAWVARRKMLDQCLELQLFYRECEQADNWMTARKLI